jgi:predicted transcriptional regulator
MSRDTAGLDPNFIKFSSDIVAAYVSNNSVPIAELPNLIHSVYTAIGALTAGSAAITSAEPEIDRPSPAQIRKSVRPDVIISFIDGKAYKTLKRHLTSHGLDPHTYRDRYGLPADYPMVAAAYAEQRSALAKAIGLGQPGAMAEREPAKRRKAA